MHTLYSTDPTNPFHKGTKFIVAFMQNSIPRDSSRPVPDAYFMVSTGEVGIVIFDVTTRFGGIEQTTTYEVNSTHRTQVSFPADTVYVTNIQQRDRAIWVRTRDDKKIALYVINDEFRSTDGFVAFPCDAMTVPNFQRYNYLILSTDQRPTDQAASIPRASQFLIVTCDDDTRVTVTPSTTVSGSGVFDQTTFGPSSPSSSANWQVDGSALIAAKQTLLILKTNDDFTGTLVSGTKPLVVITGHQCGQVTESVTACDHMAAQIPPHTTWGYKFLLIPLIGRQSGDLYRFATLLDNTEITITCVDAGGANATVEYNRTLNALQGSNWDQFETHSAACGDPYIPKYCCLKSSLPVLVAQYSYGYTRDSQCNGEFGDPFMTIIAPASQYVRAIHLTPVFIVSGTIFNHYFTVTVYVIFFQPARIMFDDAPLEPDATLWQPIYCYKIVIIICGYSITKPFDNRPHKIYHADPNGALFVHTYGFNIQNSYALAGGQELQPISGKQS